MTAGSLGMYRNGKCFGHNFDLHTLNATSGGLFLPLI